MTTVPKRNLYKKIKYQKKMAAAQGLPKHKPQETVTPFKRKPRIDHLSRVYQSSLEKQKELDLQRKARDQEIQKNEQEKKKYYQEVRPSPNVTEISRQAY